MGLIDENYKTESDLISETWKELFYRNSCGFLEPV